MAQLGCIVRNGVDVRQIRKLRFVHRDTTRLKLLMDGMGLEHRIGREAKFFDPLHQAQGTVFW